MGVLNGFMKGFVNQTLGDKSPYNIQEQNESRKRLSDDFSNMNTEQETAENTRRANWALDSNPNKQAYQELTPTDIWKNQIDAMMSSGNPQLQKRAMTMIGQKGSNGITIKNINSNNYGKMLTPEELIKWDLPPNSSYAHTATGPKLIGPSDKQGKTEKNNQMIGIYSQLDDMLFGDKGIMNNDSEKGVTGYIGRVVKGNYQNYIKDDPRYGNYDSFSVGVITNIARTIGGEKGQISDFDIGRVKELIPIVTGLNPDTKATAREKMNKLRMLIEISQARGGLTTEDITAIIGKGESVDETKSVDGTVSDQSTTAGKEVPNMPGWTFVD